jgi:hypothetical protein
MIKRRILMLCCVYPYNDFGHVQSRLGSVKYESHAHIGF